MREGMICSAGLHASLIAIAVIGLPRLWTPEPPPDIIAVELVNLPEQEETEPTKAPEPTPEPEVKPAPPSEREAPPQQAALPKSVPPPTPEPPPQPAKPEPKPEPVPEVAKPEPKPAPPVEAAKPEPKPEPKPVEPPEAEAKAPPPAPRHKPAPKPKPDEFQALLKNLAREREKQQANRQQPASEHVVAPHAETQNLSPIERRRIAADLAQAVKRQVTPCWSIPAGIKDASQMRIGVRIFLNPDGSLRGEPRIEDRRRLDGDSGYRAVAESALRALRNPRCSPLRLPINQYELWQEITFNFDPRELLEP